MEPTLMGRDVDDEIGKTKALWVPHSAANYLLLSVEGEMAMRSTPFNGLIKHDEDRMVIDIWFF